MKVILKSLVVLVFSFVAFAGCTSNDDDTNSEPLESLFNLVNISGGFAGVNEDFNKGIIIWTFDASSLKLTVENNSLSDSLYNGLETGIYDYSIIEIEDESYLYINGSEFSGYKISNTTLVLDQNLTSVGSGADGFLFTFEK